MRISLKAIEQVGEYETYLEQDLGPNGYVATDCSMRSVKEDQIAANRGRRTFMPA